MSEPKPTYNEPYPPAWDDIEPLPNYAEWLGMMGAAGWVGSRGNGWITFPVRGRTMSHNDAMEWFRIGLCPPVEDGEVLPFAEGKGGCDE